MTTPNQAPVAPLAPTTPQPGTSAPAPVAPAAPAANNGQTISHQLFPDYIDGNGNFQAKPVEDVVAPVTRLAPTPPVATPPPPSTPPTPPASPEYVDLTTLQGKLVKTVIDGVEYDLPADQAFKNIQLEKHLTHKAQRLAAQEAEFRERAKTQRLAPPAPPAGSDDDDSGEPGTQPPPMPPSTDPRIAALEAQIRQQQAAITQLGQLAEPFRQQSIVANLDAQIRAETGATDFSEYLPKIQREIQGRSTSPEEFRAAVNNPGLLLYTYQQMKIRDLISGQTGTRPGAGVPGGGTPPPPPPPVVPHIEGGGGSPGSDPGAEAWNATANKLFVRATQSGSDADWTAYIAHKHGAQE